MTDTSKKTQPAVVIPQSLMDGLREFLRNQFCDCADEYGRPRPQKCDRCRLLARIEKGDR